MPDNNKFSNIVDHYNLLIVEDNDTVHDSDDLKQYMDKWDGQDFINCLELSPKKISPLVFGTLGKLLMKSGKLLYKRC